MSDSRYLPTVVALALLPPIVVIAGLGLGLLVLEALASWCPCGSRHGCTHGAYTALTPPDVTAGHRLGRGLTVS